MKQLCETSGIGEWPRKTAGLWSVGDRCLALSDDAICWMDEFDAHWLPATITQVHPAVHVTFDGYGSGAHHVFWDEMRPAPILGPVSSSADQVAAEVEPTTNHTKDTPA